MAKSNTFILNESLRSAKIEFNTLFSHPRTVILVKISLIMVGLSWTLYGIFYQFMPPLIPLFFSRPWGQSQLVPKKLFILLPAAITMLFFINLRLASITLKKETLMAVLILTAYIISSLLGLNTLIRLLILLT